jgi:UDP-galactopyranose mutase
MRAKIIGCGISGITAGIVLKNAGYDVEIFDSRPHIGGNCYDEKMHGITVHKYGPHIFHTNDEEVWNFVNKYSEFNNYTHRVKANTKYGLISIPYNYTTRDEIGRDLSVEEIQDAIFKEYSERHWGLSWGLLPKSISSRLPTKRDNYDSRYFIDEYQGIPKQGYTHMMQNMLYGIKVNLGVSKDYFRKLLNTNDLIIYTGKPDEYFDFIYGKLEYRSLRFEHHKDNKDPRFGWNNISIINECNNSKFNRTTDNSVFLNEQFEHTVFTRDFPEEHDETNDPMYPKNFGNNLEIYAKYNELIKKEKKTVFVGRLASYKYLDMWMAIKQVFQKLKPHYE